MATTISYSTAKSRVIAILQASRTAFAAATDSTKRQYSSDNEIFTAILSADGEVCNAIINTPGHPYQNGFAATSSALTSGPDGVTVPAHNGMILRVLGLNGQTTVSVSSVSAANDEVTTVFAVRDRNPVDIYIVGIIDGRVAGAKTSAVET
jgi:hypothetical protein